MNILLESQKIRSISGRSRRDLGVDDLLPFNVEAEDEYDWRMTEVEDVSYIDRLSVCL